VEYLKRKNIEFKYHEIEDMPGDIVQKVIDANGGDDWVVPTFEYMGKWREGKFFKEDELERDLKNMGVI